MLRGRDVERGHPLPVWRRVHGPDHPPQPSAQASDHRRDAARVCMGPAWVDGEQPPRRADGGPLP
uniref:Uncharacterized protein n=1 Tax=uncultured marine virus TaxID=186617 RepID=A0A0F7L6K1_9VIRU|nr:hypothetical protein [uncultured marine virus]